MEKNITVKDPVCGMDVTTDTKYQVTHEGERYYFCSELCLHKFEANPDAYIHKPEPSEEECLSCRPIFTEHAPQTPAESEAIYTCPMHPQIRQKGPGNCPICGMALEPVLICSMISRFR